MDVRNVNSGVEPRVHSIIGYSKVPVGVNLRVNGCLCGGLYMLVMRDQSFLPLIVSSITKKKWYDRLLPVVYECNSSRTVMMWGNDKSINHFTNILPLQQLKWLQIQKLAWGGETFRPLNKRLTQWLHVRLNRQTVRSCRTSIPGGETVNHVY